MSMIRTLEDVANQRAALDADERRMREARGACTQAMAALDGGHAPVFDLLARARKEIERRQAALTEDRRSLNATERRLLDQEARR